MTLQEFISSLEKVKSELELTVRNQAAALAVSALSLIKNRIIQTQTDEKGQPFDAYSSKEYNVSLYEARVLNRAGFESLKKRKKKASYYEFRVSQGLTNERKNFEFSGQMWREILPEVVEKTKGNILILIQPTTKYAKEVYKANTDRDGELLVLSISEKGIIENSFLQYISAIFQKHGLVVSF